MLEDRWDEGLIYTGACTLVGRELPWPSIVTVGIDDGWYDYGTLIYIYETSATVQDDFGLLELETSIRVVTTLAWHLVGGDLRAFVSPEEAAESEIKRVGIDDFLGFIYYAENEGLRKYTIPDSSCPNFVDNRRQALGLPSTEKAIKERPTQVRDWVLETLGLDDDFGSRLL